MILKFLVFCHKTGPVLKQHKRQFSSLFGRSVNYLFKKNLLLTNGLSSGMFMGLGDLIQQEYEYNSKTLPERYDWQRAGRMFIVGCFLGPLHHYYYIYLDKVLPRADIKTILKKVALDQGFCSPLTIVCFYYSLGMLENKSLAQATEEVKNKFLYTYLGDWFFWPPVQCINFYYVPTPYRVFYINAATMIFNVFLSYMKHDFHGSKVPSKAS